MKILLHILFIFISHLCFSQNIRVSVKYNINKMDLENYKKIQTDFLRSQDILVPLKIVDGFPSRPSLQFCFELVDFFDGISIGAFYDFSSTGGKIHYQDYSGEVAFIQYSNRDIFGASFSYGINKSVTGIQTDFGLNGLFIFTEFKEDDFIQVGNQRESNVLEFNSFSIGLEPRIGFSYRLSFIVLKTELSYLKDFGGELKLKNNDKVNFIYSDGSNIKSDWTGLKIGLSVGVLL